MKIRRIKFGGGGQAFQHKRTHLAEVSAAWIGFFGKHEGLWKQKQQLQAGAGLV